MKWHAESDGGVTYCGTYTLYQPKTHYVTNGETRIDCQSKIGAIKKAAQLNAAQLNKENENVGIPRR